MAGHQVTAVAMATGQQQTVLPRKLVLFDVVVRRSALCLTNVYIYICHLPRVYCPTTGAATSHRALTALCLFNHPHPPHPERIGIIFIFIFFLNVMQADK